MLVYGVNNLLTICLLDGQGIECFMKWHHAIIDVWACTYYRRKFKSIKTLVQLLGNASSCRNYGGFPKLRTSWIWSTLFDFLAGDYRDGKCLADTQMPHSCVSTLQLLTKIEERNSELLDYVSALVFTNSSMFRILYKWNVRNVTLNWDFFCWCAQSQRANT